MHREVGGGILNGVCVVNVRFRGDWDRLLCIERNALAVFCGCIAAIEVGVVVFVLGGRGARRCHQNFRSAAEAVLSS